MGVGANSEIKKEIAKIILKEEVVNESDSNELDDVESFVLQEDNIQ